MFRDVCQRFACELPGRFDRWKHGSCGNCTVNEIRRSALDDGTGNALCVSTTKFSRIADEKEFVTLCDTEQHPDNNRVY